MHKFDTQNLQNTSSLIQFNRHRPRNLCFSKVSRKEILVDFRFTKTNEVDQGENISTKFTMHHYVYKRFDNPGEKRVYHYENSTSTGKMILKKSLCF